MEYSDCRPWPVPETRCHSNVRIVRRTFTRSAGEEIAEEVLDEVLPFEDPSDAGRVDLRLTVPAFGVVYLHVLAWWLVYGRPKRRFDSWAKFRASGYVVDHGDDGMPHVCDWRTLRILPNSGKRSNASQGAKLRSKYARQGGLKAVVDRSTSQRRKVKKKPSKN